MTTDDAKPVYSPESNHLMVAAPVPAGSHYDTAIRSLILGLALFLVYSANGRPIGGFDTMPATFVPMAIIRGDGLVLDRFESVFQKPDGSLHLSVTRERNHIVSRYPVGPAILAVPFELPQVLVLDWLYPGWEQETPYRCLGLSKNAAAAIAAIQGVALFHLLQTIGLGRLRLWTMFAAAFASNLWTVASQSLWQHGPAALALTLSMLLLVHPQLTRTRLFLAGLTTAAMVCFRSIDILFAASIFFWVWRCRTKNLVWFLPMPILCAGALLAYNYYYFGTALGGQAQLESLHLKLHDLESAWSKNPFESAAGTLFSPSHGLFIFTPWIAVALATFPAVSVRLKQHPLIYWLILTIVPYFVFLSFYSIWWGGHSFGPRYWTDVIPLYAVLLGFGLEWSWKSCREVFFVFLATIAFSLAVQMIGAFCYPSSWETSPNNVDLHHERLWDWRDSELSRSLTEGLK